MGVILTVLTLVLIEIDTIRPEWFLVLTKMVLLLILVFERLLVLTDTYLDLTVLRSGLKWIWLKWF